MFKVSLDSVVLCFVKMKIIKKNQKKKLITATTIVLLLTVLKEKRIDRSCWVHDWLLKFGTESNGLWYENVFEEWTKTNQERFKRTLRLSPAAFDQLLEMVTPIIERQDTHLRKSVNPRKRLAVTLKFLATGNSFVQLLLINPHNLNEKKIVTR